MKFTKAFLLTVCLSSFLSARGGTLEEILGEEAFLQSMADLEEEYAQLERISVLNRETKMVKVATTVTKMCVGTDAPAQMMCQRGNPVMCTKVNLCCKGFACIKKKCQKCSKVGSSCNNKKDCCSNKCAKVAPPPPPPTPAPTPSCPGPSGTRPERARDNIQIFYYPWYGGPTAYRHWNINRRVEGGRYSAENDDLPSPYFPKLGAYDSAHVPTIEKHMEWIARAGVGVVILSWWGIGSYEDQQSWKILNAADAYNLKVAFYIEPHSGGFIRDTTSSSSEGTRTPKDAQADVKYLIDTYGCHRALYRREGRPVMLFFAARAYDQGRQGEWKNVWDELHAIPKYNPVVITQDILLQNRIIAGGWDGGHDYGCGPARDATSQWASLADSYAAAKKIFYFTVCPGNDKTRLSGPADYFIEREDGAFYDHMWEAAMKSKKSSKWNPVVITTFNEWHVGSSIEPAIPKAISSYVHQGNTISAYTYKDYEGAWGHSGEKAEFAYIDRSKELADIFLSL